MLKIHHLPRARGLRVVWLCEEMGLPYEIAPVTFPLPEAYRAINPMGTVPFLEDDGVGIPEANLAKLFEQGIGVSNVNERLKVLFGGDYRMWVDSRPGEGTRTGIEFPATSQGGTPPEQRLARAS